MWDEIIAQGAVILITALGSLLLFALRKVANKVTEKMDADSESKEVVEAVLAGMAKAQDEVVRETKKAALDGKLTKEEIQKALKIAQEEAITVAKGNAKNLILAMAPSMFDSLVKSLLKKFKND